MRRGVEDEELNRAAQGLHGVHGHYAGENRYLEDNQNPPFEG